MHRNFPYYSFSTSLFLRAYNPLGPLFTNGLPFLKSLGLKPFSPPEEEPSCG